MGRSENGLARRRSCLGLAWHGCRAVLGPPPRHGGPTRSRHENGLGPTGARLLPSLPSPAVGSHRHPRSRPFDQTVRKGPYISIPPPPRPNPNPRPVGLAPPPYPGSRSGTGAARRPAGRRGGDSSSPSSFPRLSLVAASPRLQPRLAAASRHLLSSLVSVSLNL
jgi:hypothetical protein